MSNLKIRVMHGPVSGEWRLLLCYACFIGIPISLSWHHFNYCSFLKTTLSFPFVYDAWWQTETITNVWLFICFHCIHHWPLAFYIFFFFILHSFIPSHHPCVTWHLHLHSIMVSVAHSGLAFLACPISVSLLSFILRLFQAGDDSSLFSVWTHFVAAVLALQAISAFHPCHSFWVRWVVCNQPSFHFISTCVYLRRQASVCPHACTWRGLAWARWFRQWCGLWHWTSSRRVPLCSWNLMSDECDSH